MAQAIAKGNASLTVDDLALEARLVFTPSPQGGEWSADKLMKLALDARLPSLSPKRAEELVGKFSRARGPQTEILAKGTAPEDALPEEAEWAGLPVPEELRELVEKNLLSAEAPELWRSVVKTIKTEKKVSHKAALPFLPPRVETVTVQEKLESRERVWPDPEVLKTGLARKGERIGLLSAAKPGKPGKDIFGKPLSFSGEPGTFILGRGIERNKNELLAEEDGILRAGRLWAEIIPLPSHHYEVRLGSDGTTYLLDYSPGHRGLPAPDPEAILAKARELGAAEGELMDAELLRSSLRDSILSGNPLSALSLSLDRDAEARVDIEADGSRALLALRKGRGRGRPFELGMVTAALRASGLRGFKMEEVKKAVLEFYRGPAAELRDFVLLEGRPPSRGRDRSLGLAIAALPKEKVEEFRRRLAEQGGLEALSLDPRLPLEETSIMAFVRAGQRVGELSPPSPGQPGLDVWGRTVPGLPGNDPVVHCLGGLTFMKGSLKAELDGLLLAADRQGSWALRVLPLVDASIRVEVAADGMAAYLDLRAERGLGAPLEVEAVMRAVAERGVVFGVDPRKIAEAVAAARSSGSVERRLVAEGRRPRPRGSGRLEWLVEAPPSGGGGGSRVAEGQEILLLHGGSAEGEEGRDVLGKPLPVPPSGSEEPSLPPYGEGLEERPLRGGRALVALRAGQLSFEKGRLLVRDRLVVEGDLGAQGGERRFGGAVEVRGGLRSGLRLFAAGDVTVQGAVEDVLVSSEGGLAVQGGIKGARKATLRSMRGMRLAYAEQALLLAVEDIHVAEACVLCNVKTNGRLSVLGGKGSLVGGLVKARNGIEVESLGSERGLKTEVAFGQDYLVGDMIETEEGEIEKVKSAILQSDRLMRELERAGAGLDRVRQDKVKLLKLLEKRSARLFDFREKFEQHFPSEVRVRGTIWPGVILESHNRFFEVRSRKTAVIFSFDPSNGRIVERPLR